MDLILLWEKISVSENPSRHVNPQAAEETTRSEAHFQSKTLNLI